MSISIKGLRLTPSELFRRPLLLMLMATGLLAGGTGSAFAYVGPSFVQIPGLEGGWQGQRYNNWLRLESHQWLEGNTAEERPRLRGTAWFSHPVAPREGAGTVAVTLDKQHPLLPRLMEFCASKDPLPELAYAESSELARDVSELGPKPAGEPDYFEYRLKDVVFQACPVVEGAPEQPFVLAFSDIEWLNFAGEGSGVKLTLAPAQLPPLDASGETRVYVMSWFGVAHDVSDDQCSGLNAPPPQEDYFAFMSADEAAREREALGDAGPRYQANGLSNPAEMALRGPGKLNVCALPGTLPDPGHIAPQPTLARGLNLDGYAGSEDRRSGGARQAVSYRSEDGRTGISNQLYTVQGCIPGYQGRKGFLMQYYNEQMRNGLGSPLLMISGIDDELNDDSIQVSLLYSHDHMAKNAVGTEILPYYTFGLTSRPEHTHYFVTLPGRIVDGVVMTDRVDKFHFNPPMGTLITLHEGGLRLELLPDGDLKGVMAGYRDWRHDMAMVTATHSNGENLYGYQCPAIYNAYRRAADGLPDPVTGEFWGISSVYDIEAVAAHIPPSELQALREGRVADFIAGVVEQ